MNKNGNINQKDSSETDENMLQKPSSTDRKKCQDPNISGAAAPNKPVKLSELIAETAKQTDGYNPFFVLDKGTYVIIPDDAFIALDEGANEENIHLYHVKKEELEIAAAVESGNPNYIGLPDDLMVDPDEMMLAFFETVECDEIYDRLQRSFYKPDSFAGLLDILDDKNLLEAWFAFRDDHYRKVALHWCESHKVEYVE